MYWDMPRPITGPVYDRLAVLLRGNCALYSNHLPLDAHPRLGNNALLARQLGLKPTAASSCGMASRRLDRPKPPETDRPALPPRSVLRSGHRARVRLRRPEGGGVLQWEWQQRGA